MLTIYLNDLLFSGYHGIFHEEKVLGGQFRVNIELNYNPHGALVKDINQTINYVHVFELVKGVMEKPTPLLETLVADIAKTIMDHFELVQQAFVKVEKVYPPITGFQGRVGVSTIVQREV